MKLIQLIMNNVWLSFCHNHFIWIKTDIIICQCMLVPRLYLRLKAIFYITLWYFHNLMFKFKIKEIQIQVSRVLNFNNSCFEFITILYISGLLDTGIVFSAYWSAMIFAVFFSFFNGTDCQINFFHYNQFGYDWNDPRFPEVWSSSGK